MSAATGSTILTVALGLFMLARFVGAAIMSNMAAEKYLLTLRGLGGLTKSASSILMMTPVGGCGFLLMGLVADNTGNMVMPFFIPLIGFAFVLAYAYKCVKRGFIK